MAKLKTGPTGASVAAFLGAIPDPERRRDCKAIVRLMARITGARPRLWGPSIVGFGRYHYRYASGREGDWFLAGFSPRARNIVLYVMAGISTVRPWLATLGPHRTGKSCLYIRRLADVDQITLASLVEASVAAVRQRHAEPAVSRPPTSARK